MEFVRGVFTMIAPKTLWITRTAIERGARAIYKNAGWDRQWKDIAPAGRARFRKAAVDAIFAAIPNAVRQIGSKTRPARSRVLP